MTLNHQFLTMGAMLLCGAGLGLLLDLVRITTRERWLGRIMRHLLDLLYWFIATLVILLTLYKTNGVQIRPITFIAILIGAIIYFGLASSIFVPIMQQSIGIVKALVLFFWKAINFCIILPLSWGCGFLIATSVFLYKLVIQLHYFIWQRFRSKE